MSWAGLAGAGVRRWHSEVEGRRFGITVARVVVGANTPDVASVADDFLGAVNGSSEDLVIARWPGELTGMGAIAARSSRRVIPADMLTYWEVPAGALADSGGDGLPEGYQIHLPGEPSAAVEEAISTVVEDSFRGYGNHYTANPDLDPELALAGYLEWAVGAFHRDPHNVVLLLEGDEPRGVATLTQDDEDLEIELAGMVGGAQGRGLYGHLLAAIGQEALRRGRPRVIISTQAHNVRVQRAWVRAGMKPFATTTTVHLPLPQS